MTRLTYRALRQRLDQLHAELDGLVDDYAHDNELASQLAQLAGGILAVTDALNDKRDPLPVGQQRVFAFLKRYHDKHGFMPTRKEIGDGLDCAVNNAHEHLRAMARNGWIRLRQGEARGIELIEEPWTAQTDSDGAGAARGLEMTPWIIIGSALLVGVVLMLWATRKK